VRADRELPVVWAVAKGSALNKAILVPMALAISAFAPWLVTLLLMVGARLVIFDIGEGKALSTLKTCAMRMTFSSMRNAAVFM